MTILFSFKLALNDLWFSDRSSTTVLYIFAYFSHSIIASSVFYITIYMFQHTCMLSVIIYDPNLCWDHRNYVNQFYPSWCSLYTSLIFFNHLLQSSFSHMSHYCLGFTESEIILTNILKFQVKAAPKMSLITEKATWRSYLYIVTRTLIVLYTFTFLIVYTNIVYTVISTFTRYVQHLASFYIICMK